MSYVVQDFSITITDNNEQQNLRFFSVKMERLVRSYMITPNDSTQEFDSIISSAVNELHNGQNLLSLVQSLGEFLTSEDSAIRAKGTRLLSSVLSECPQEQINNSAANVLVDFYCERLSDTTSVPDLIYGLRYLPQFGTFRDEHAIKVSKAIFANINVQSLQQIVRHEVLQILDILLHHHLHALKQLGPEFVLGYIQSMDGEKDPRNLLLAFSSIKLIIQEFDILPHVESLFEVTFCYFPITFKPPPDDPYGITADDLKVALRECLSATSHFSKFAMPLLVDKLASSSGNAKKDSMETLKACAPVYGSSAIIPHLEILWNYLKDEVINATNDSFELIALEAIQSIAETLSADGIEKLDHLQQFLKIIVTECLENLENSELKLAKPCGKILKYCAMASDPACNIIISATLNNFINQYRMNDLATRKKGILEILTEFIAASRYLYGSVEDVPAVRAQGFVMPLVSYKDDMFEIFSSALLGINEYNELRLCGLQGLHDMILLNKFLSDSEIGVILQYFNKIILDEQDQDIVLSTLKCLENIAHYRPKIVLDVALPIFVSKLPNIGDAIDKGSHTNYSKILDSISKISVEPILFEALVPEILAKLDNVLSPLSSVNCDYTEAILQALHSLLLKKSSLGHTDVSRYVDTIIPHLLARCVEPTLNFNCESEQYTVFCDLRIIRVVAGIISTITKSLNVSEQTTFVGQIFELFTRGNTSYLRFSLPETNVPFNPLSLDSSSHQKNLTLCFTAAIGSIRQEVQSSLSDIFEFLTKIVGICLSTPNEIQQHSLAQLAASILNKWDKEPELIEFAQAQVLGELLNQLSSTSGLETIRCKSLYLFLWLTKALVLRTHQLGYDCTGQIINLFSDPILGKQSAEGIGIIIGESDILNRQGFATIKILYKQRFFNYCVPIIIERFKSSDDVTKHNYLMALSHLLRNIPKQVLMNDLPS
ncbi:10758_t:CDS:10, partial [Dentiscutata erythropus]